MSQQASMSHPLLQIIADSIREPSVSSRCCCDCLKVCQWSAAYQIPSHEPAGIHEPVIWHRWNYEPSVSRPCGSAGIYEVSVIADYCRYHPMSQQISVRCPCLLDAVVSREVCSWYRWNYEPSVRCVPGTDGIMSRPCLLDAVVTV